MGYYNDPAQKPINHRDDFAKNIHAALDETFDVASITFHEANVRMIDLPREGWQETPLAYAVLRAKDAAVDRIPSIQIDMDFVDQPGQVVLPVLSQVQPIDAKDTEAGLRPCDNLTLTMTMDEREWRDGKVVVEVAARGRGVIPSLKQMFDYEREGFDVEVSDNGLSVVQLVSDGNRKLAPSDRGWQLTYRRKKDLRGDVVFHFPKLKAEIKPETVEYKHYQDADLVTVDAKTALAGVPLAGHVSRGLRNGLVGLGLVLLGIVAYLLVRARQRKEHRPVDALALPAQLTPFSVVAFLRRIQRDYKAKLAEADREALKAQIREIEGAFFSGTQPSENSPNLDTVARKWLQAIA